MSPVTLSESPRSEGPRSTSPRRVSPLPAPHPKGKNVHILLSSVFGPYACDDAYGSRKVNPMELYHNQVTRTQGPFSLRMFHRSWGIMMIQANIEAPCTVLDFPVRERFIEEIQTQTYDVIGISAIVPNILKVKDMCNLVRLHQPNARIVIGGHIANIPDLEERTDADDIVRGDGVCWFRALTGEPTDQPFRHPAVLSGIGARTLGTTLSEKPREVAATLIPSVGCPVGCNFCSTSAMFGGKGKFLNFYETGDELFTVMCQLEETLKVNSFFVMDENFLLHRSRALRLLELIEEHNKAWSLYVFSSAKVLRSYRIEQLIRLGISWVWMGIEGKDSRYSKLNGVDTFDLVQELQSHGIRILGSTIIGLEEHTPENLEEAIEQAARHATDFHQFMLYTPLPGTELHRTMSAEDRMLPENEVDPSDIHGQTRFNYRHPHIPAGSEGDWLIRAFDCDFERNGPSITRIARTTLAGWLRYHNHPDPRIVQRFRNEAAGLRRNLAGVLLATRRHYRDQPTIRKQLQETLHECYRAFGWTTRLRAWLVAPILQHRLKAEARRLARGWTYEPPTFYERNAFRSDAPAIALAKVTAGCSRRRKMAGPSTAVSTS